MPMPRSGRVDGISCRRLVVLKIFNERLIAQKQSAAEAGLTERQIWRLLRRLKDGGDKAVIHGSSGRTSNRKIAVCGG